jgi:hypothetical protein
VKYIYAQKKRPAKVSFLLFSFSDAYQPTVGAVSATGVLSAAARSSGKL